MTAASTPAGDDRTPEPELDAKEIARREFAEEVGLYYEIGGTPRMDGRILGYLLIMPLPYISSGELGRVLSASAGSISMSTRRLMDLGLIRRQVVPGDRSHYFRAHADPWGGLLAGERRYLQRYQEIFQQGLDILSAEDDDQGAVTRVTNARDYMTWLVDYNRKMRDDWEAFKATRDSAAE